MVVSRARLYEAVRRSALQRVHVRERCQLYVPSVEKAEDGHDRLAGAHARGGAWRSDLFELLHASLRARLSLVADGARADRLSAHLDRLSGTDFDVSNADGACVRARRFLHLASREYRDVLPSMEVSRPARRLADGRLKQDQLMVPAGYHQRHYRGPAEAREGGKAIQVRAKAEARESIPLPPLLIIRTGYE